MQKPTIPILKHSILKGCDYSASARIMMGYGYGGAMWGISFLGTLMWIVILVDLILLGMWLWKKIGEK